MNNYLKEDYEKFVYALGKEQRLDNMYENKEISPQNYHAQMRLCLWMQTETLISLQDNVNRCLNILGVSKEDIDAYKDQKE